ncbi:hypothetical protein MIMGU_mgv1a025626mg [Erythranthe guttata]|uniref:F-box domain-containing protein n=1 Tax=Erythranthe guttata TaxID=4155 RepID=A0A022Q3T2_ERYGU|nr:PREDICTED: F-box/kelch-repeat protein At3g23880-like [Erythranthe guttata]EYU22631.1 hypothetical protein MIMGU_mgv1a025626mg [Erythranthe guttata]|eukprot:XP_012855149.1 PREDICTED: F-box/kelch-repeat protein At3g23880-like [Erythranthe guttata]
METGKAEQITDNIPQEIIEEILCRLPVKSLSRFKCVSPSGRSMISSKQFIKTHLQRSKKIESFADQRITSTCQGKLKACSLSSLLTEPVIRAFSIDFFPMNSSNDIVIVGSCNGLICVLVDACRFFLLNPSTRESKELPDFFTGAMFPKNVGSIRGYGFGFDESSGDYKVCVVCYMMLVFGSNVTFPSTARVYSLKVDSWGRNLFFKDVCIFGSAKFVSGKLHWISDFKTKSKWDDVCFDLKSETFGIVKQASCIEGYYSPRLGVLKGYLCVFSGYSPTSMFDVWIWNEYGVEDSNYVTPLFVLPCGEVLFTYESDFFIYNKKDNCVTQQHTVDFDRDRHGEAEVYIESLVSLALDD